MKELFYEKLLLNEIEIQRIMVKCLPKKDIKGKNLDEFKRGADFILDLLEKKAKSEIPWN